VSINLRLKNVCLPKASLFNQEIKALIDWCIADHLQTYPMRTKSRQALSLACKTLIEGLYQANSAVGGISRLEVPLSPKFYHTTAPGKINHLSCVFIQRAVDGLEQLGWIKKLKGYQSIQGNVVTRISANGPLAKTFSNIGLQWQELTTRKDLIVLRKKDPDTRQVSTLKAPNTATVRQMKQNLQVINSFLTKQAICLHLQNHQMSNLSIRSKTMQEKYGSPLIFNLVSLHRVFSKGLMDHGGRFYGAWWQFIKSQYRPYLTINGLATGEVDYSEMHPRLLYHLHNQPPPQGDLYDDGWRNPGHPTYKKSISPYKERRALIKTVFNAFINDEFGRFRLSKDEAITAKKFGLTLASIRKLLYKKHPLLKGAHKTGIGLKLQFIDSQIAEHVMLSLLNQGITCLPVHDSFIVPMHQVSELQTAMTDAYMAIVGKPPKLKDLQPFKSGFQLPFNPSGEVDRQALHSVHGQSIHNKFMESRFRAIHALPPKRTPRAPPIRGSESH